MNLFNKPVLYLDYDGVLHPDEVYRRKDGSIFVSNAPGENAALFQHAPLLESLLEHRDVHIVLATSWVKVLGFKRAKANLPSAIQEKVVGATYHSSMRRDWSWFSRYQQIMQHVDRHGITGWLALDNDNEGWREEHHHHLALCDDINALPSAQHVLLQWLDRVAPLPSADTSDSLQFLG